MCFVFVLFVFVFAFLLGKYSLNDVIVMMRNGTLD